LPSSSRIAAPGRNGEAYAIRARPSRRSIHANIPAIVKLPGARKSASSANTLVTMPSSLTDIIDAWHDFDVLLGTAAATLVGLMFVAASIGASVFTEKDRAAMKAFISPTVVHFSAVLFVAIVALIPSHGWPSLAGLLTLVGLPGALYSANLWFQLFVHRRFNIDIADRLFYALIPVLGYLLLLLAAFVLFRQSAAGLDLLAAAQITLLLAAIRNAWDMMIWIVIKAPIADTADRDGA
jgi:hypothetical protein